MAPKLSMSTPSADVARWTPPVRVRGRSMRPALTQGLWLLTCAAGVSFDVGDIVVLTMSPDPFEPPEMQPNYRATDLDRRTNVAAVKAARAIAASPAMKGLVKHEVKPGPDANDEAALLKNCRNNGATILHPSGTCSMGPDPVAGAVVDARLRVHGVQGLRVIDCSVMPTLVSGNTNAPAVMMAEKAVDMIREDAVKR